MNASINANGAPPEATTPKLSFCRLCMGHCGMVLEVDSQERLTGIKADREDSQSLGYACFKGLQAVEAHNGPQRILRPLRRRPDGGFDEISLDQAFDEIATKLRSVVDQHGAEAVAGYKGGGAFFNASAVFALNDFLQSLGSPKMFSTVTIDQSAKVVALGRGGLWSAGLVPFHRADVLMLFGANPLVSVASSGVFDIRNPLKRLKAAKERGLKLIVIDPRLSETARYADVFLQPLPGEDPTIIAGLINIILDRGWQDQAFTSAHVGDIDRLKTAVQAFTPQYVEQRAGVPASLLIKAAEMFARDARRGPAAGATGPDMSPYGNLAEHLILGLNALCGRFLREGERIDNPGVLMPRYPKHAHVIPAPRWWEQGYQSRLGYGLLDGELPTGIFADEILTPGKGQVRCVISHGGNPASAIPEQRRVVEALRALDLLVSIEPYMTATARLSHYIIPPKLMYERADLPIVPYESLIYPDAFTRYTAPAAKPPEGAQVIDDAIAFWEIARRMGVAYNYRGEQLDMASQPTIDHLLSIISKPAPVSFGEIKRHDRGAIFDGEPQHVLPADPAIAGKFTLMPDDVAKELDEAYCSYTNIPSSKPRYRFAVRRHRDTMNSVGRVLSSVRKRISHNTAFMNPQDMRHEEIRDGDWIVIRSEYGEMRILAEGDETLRTGVVAVTHGFGGLPNEDEHYFEQGVSPNLILSSQRHRDAINAMPRMSGITVDIEKAPL